jgi:hypothetical protein
MRLQVRTFAGMRPARSADLLAPGEAQVATDVRLTAGELRPLNGLSTSFLTLSGAPQVVSVYRFGQSVASNTQYWFQSAVDADYAKGPIDNDTEERTYWTDGVFPKKTNAALATSGAPYPSASYAMGIPAPAAAPTVAVTGVATNPDDPAETVVFVMTYVSAWGVEGPPSAASVAVSWRAGQSLDLSALSVAPGAGAHGENYNITGKRIYRSATGTSSTQYQWCSTLGTAGTIPIATTTASSTAVTADLGDVLETIGWLQPQYNMIGLCAGPNGMMAGFVGNTLMFCEPNVPYAWPVRYQQSTDAPIVGIAWFDQTVFVGTTQGLYLFTGVDPANMTSQKLPAAQSVVAKRSIVAMTGGVIFASPDGLWQINGGGLTCLTEGLMTRADWQAYVPSTISAYESDNRYLAFFNTGSRTGGMLFDFSSTPTFSEVSTYAYAGFRDKKADALFLVDAANTVKKFDAASALSYTWTSGVFAIPGDVNMGAASVDASAYPLTLKLYADGTLKHTQTVANRFAFRLPSGYTSKRYHFELTGTSIVRNVEIASTVEELTQQ